MLYTKSVLVSGGGGGATKESIAFITLGQQCIPIRIHGPESPQQSQTRITNAVETGGITRHLRFEVFEAKVFVSSFGRCAMALSYPQKLTKSRRPCSIPSMIPIPCLGLLSLLLPTLSYGSAKFRDSDLHTSSRTFGFVACRL